MASIVFTSHVHCSQPELAGIIKFFQELESLGHTITLISNCDEKLTDPWRLPYFEIKSSNSALEASLIHEFGDELKKWELRVDGWGSKTFSADSGHEFVHRMLLYSDSLLRALKPDLLLVWNPYQPIFGILHDLAKIRGINCGFLEWGIVRKSVYITPEFPMFSSLLYSSFLDKASADFLQQNSNDRTTYKAAGSSYLSSLKNDQPGLLYVPEKATDSGFEWYISESNSLRILCLGIGDYQGGAYPFDHPNRRNRMPLFPSGWNLANTLAQNSEWKVLYKAHPHGSISRPSHADALNLQESKVSAVELIKASDVVVAWGTKLELEALALGKPVVLAGSGNLWNKGCAYQVTNSQNLVSVVQEAASTGVQSSQLDCLAAYLGWLISEELFFLDYEDSLFGQTFEERLLVYVNRFTKRFSKALISGKEANEISFFLAQVQRERAESRMFQMRTEKFQVQMQKLQMQLQEYRNPLVYYWKKAIKKLTKI